MKDPDFKDFKPLKPERWMELVQKELGSKPYDSIIWHDANGLELEPYFTSAPAQVLDVPEKKGVWEICQVVEGDDLRQANAKALQYLEGGVSSIGFRCAIRSAADLDIVLENIGYDFVSVHFLDAGDPVNLARWLISKARTQGLDTRKLRGSIHTHSLVAGKDRVIYSELALIAVENFSLFHIMVVEPDRVHNAGGNMVQEIAFALSVGHEFVHRMQEQGIGIDQSSAMLRFNFATGTEYFPEIAKLRVFRSLWKTVVDQYQPIQACSSQCFIHCTTSRIARADKDVQTNLLRSSTIAMSAALGGADSIEILSHDPMSDAEMPMRLARNIQHLLIEEAGFSEAIHAARGSYYLEHMQVRLAEKAWDLFRDMESRGGMNAAHEYFHTLVHDAAAVRKQQVDEGMRVVVGVNKYVVSGK